MEHALRSARPDDLDALVGLLRACDEVDVGSVETTEDDVKWPWRAPGFSLAEDTFVIDDGGAPVGYSFVFEGEGEAWVHPSHRGRGIGTVLLTEFERRGNEQKSPDGKLRQNVTSRDLAGRALLESHGFSESHHYARMEIEMDAPPGIPPAPKRIEVTNLVAGTEREVYEAYVASWAQYAPSWRDEGFERWSLVFEEGDFDPELWFVARRAGKIVAFEQGLAYPGLGWVQMLGTLPEERGSGLGRLLLMHALAAFHRRGIGRVGLTVSSRNLPAARRLYERTGFEETIRYVNMAKDVP